MALDALKFVIQEEVAPRTRIRVFGVGGGGSNAVARMLQEGLAGVEFCWKARRVQLSAFITDITRTSRRETQPCRVVYR